MTEPLVTVETTIEADSRTVWDALTAKKSAMFMGADVDTDWSEGSPLKMSGEFQGRTFEDHGEIRTAEPRRHLAFTHFSGSQREQGNLVDIRLEPVGNRTKATLSQTPLGATSPPDESKVAEFRKNWEMMLGSLKTAAEQRNTAEA